MKFIFFFTFLLITLLYIWNGKDLFNKKDWLAFLIKFLLVVVGGFVWALILVFVVKFFPGLGYYKMRSLAVIIPESFMAILFCKLFVVMLCTIFKTILRFHEHSNTRDNYLKVASIFTHLGPKSLIVAKCLSSFSAILMFYGIWLANAA